MTGDRVTVSLLGEGERSGRGPGPSIRAARHRSFEDGGRVVLRPIDKREKLMATDTDAPVDL